MNKQKSAAFTLVEVTLALGIASFCLIALLGLIPVGLTATNSASEDLAAMSIAKSIALDLKQSPTSVVKSKIYEIAFPTTLNAESNSGLDPSFKVDSAGEVATTDARYQVTINMIKPSKYEPTRATIYVSWPAGATLDKARGFVTVFSIFDRN